MHKAPVHNEPLREMALRPLLPLVARPGKARSAWLSTSLFITQGVKQDPFKTLLAWEMQQSYSSALHSG